MESNPYPPKTDLEFVSCLTNKTLHKWCLGLSSQKKYCSFCPTLLKHTLWNPEFPSKKLLRKYQKGNFWDLQLTFPVNPTFNLFLPMYHKWKTAILEPPNQSTHQMNYLGWCRMDYKILLAESWLKSWTITSGSITKWLMV